MDRPDDRSLELLADAVEHVGQHGHVITAPEVGISAWYLAVVLAPVLFGLALAAIWAQHRRPRPGTDAEADDDADTGAGKEKSGSAFQPTLAASSLVAGLALASILFPNAVSEVGTALYQAAMTSVAIGPPSVYAGSRCAAALPDEPLVATLDDGCAERGSLALVSYPLRGLLLVASEARLARPAVAPSPDAVKAGMIAGYKAQHWGLQWAPYTAEAMGNGQRAQLATSLDLGSLLLFCLTVVIGASLWVRAQPILAAWGVDLRDPAQQDRWAEAVALRNYLLYAVLGLGAYLSFAALTALGPFVEARRLAEESGRNFTQTRIDEIAQEWSGANLELNLADDADLAELESSVRRYRSLRATSLDQVFLRLRGDHEAVVSRLNEIVRWVDELERVQAIPAGDGSTEGSGTGVLLDRRPTTEGTLAAARALRQTADDGLVQVSSFAPFQSANPSLSESRAQREGRIRLVTQLHARLAEQQAALVAAESAAASTGLASIPVGRLSQPTLLGPLEQFGDAVHEAEAEYLLSGTTAEDEMRKLQQAVLGLRGLREDMRQAEGRLNRRLHEQGRSAQGAVRRAQSEFGAVQRSGPAWLDRQEALVGWMSLAYHTSREQLQACGDDVVTAFNKTSGRAALAAGALPSPESLGDGAPLSQDVSFQLEQFRATLLDDPPLLPDCVGAKDVAPTPPQRLGTGARYGTTVGLLAGWLMQSGTVELVLVAGMLGFGLLGAGLSRVVRRKLEVQERKGELAHLGEVYVPEPIVENVPSIVFQGLGATLIVYLAGVGGLGAISTSAPELDPHVLMLGCFTAAVFSEEVWRAARSWVRERAPSRRRSSSGDTSAMEGSIGSRRPEASTIKTDTH